MRVMLALFVAFLGFGCISQNVETPQPDDGVDTSNAITQKMCEDAGGHWNECGSACRGEPPGSPCILMCVQYCECGGIAGFGCPAGYICTDYLPEGAADAMGICKKVSQ